MRIKVTNQQELDAACEKQKIDSNIVIEINSAADVWLVLRGSSHAVLRESSHAELWGSSHAVLRESSHAVLRGSSHAELWESSHAVLRESSHAVARDRCVIKASPQSSITIHGDTPSIDGGIQIKYKSPGNAQAWAEEYGVDVKDGVVILFKGVNEDYTTNGHTRTSGVKAVSYAPGTMPQAEDWDGGKIECGKGLHFSPTASATLRYNENAKHFMACPVKLEDIVVHANAEYPDKVKAKGVCAPIWEVDRRGNKI
jgi:hypothetical protein